MTFTAGRFVLVLTSQTEDNVYVTSWDRWEDCFVAFESNWKGCSCPGGDSCGGFKCDPILEWRMPPDMKLIDDQTGRVWHPGARYQWEDAQT